MNWLARQLEDPVGRARIRRWFYVSLGAVATAEVAVLLLLLLDQRLAELHLATALHLGHPHLWFEWIPAWGSLWGLASCVAIIVVSKLLGKVWLMRREDFYDR